MRFTAPACEWVQGDLGGMRGGDPGAQAVVFQVRFHQWMQGRVHEAGGGARLVLRQDEGQRLGSGIIGAVPGLNQPAHPNAGESMKRADQDQGRAKRENGIENQERISNRILESVHPSVESLAVYQAPEKMYENLETSMISPTAALFTGRKVQPMGLGLTSPKWGQASRHD